MSSKKGLNPSASAFNPSAAAFVPSWIQQAPPPQQTSQQNVQYTPQQNVQEPKQNVQQQLNQPAQQSLQQSQQNNTFSKPAVSKSLNANSQTNNQQPVSSPHQSKSEKPAAVEKKVNEDKKPSEEKKTERKEKEFVETANLISDELAFANLKDHLNIIFIGHVDAGKSTMGGHILYLTGMVDKRTMEKYEKEAKECGRESWYLSWALDLNPEERNKGKTVEYGRGYFETKNRKYTILDAPGHKNFVPSMISGAAQADVGILVISARKGEFEAGFERGGQSREHAQLAKTAGVNRLIVVINKMDDPTVAWSKERYDECTGKLVPFLKSCGYNPKTDITLIPISGFTGANMKDKVDPKVCPWYSGPSLLDLLDSIDLKDRKFDGPLMMPIADKFKEMGTVVTGKIESGTVKRGQTVLIMPNKKMAEVLAIFSEDSEVQAARSGDNIRIRLKNVEEEDVLSGFVLCGPNKPVHTVTAFEAQIAIREHSSIICAGYGAVMHAHTMTEEVTLAALLHKVDRKTGKKTKKPIQFVKQGEVCIVRIETTQPVCLENYADYQQLGRFTLRDEGKTVAIGRITKLILSESE
ncbi:translation termination factor GTPase eRF3 [Clydaea vesicula]|uniref:Eukaryotic peptide chain release factor GTP-binding subunit n=1 Tax=Clydaea vesicula TaxID=447962 RepID=A0AAD5U5E4_9FUNG|nr:translation termination factor GTPase eRF3 [Clydaea vesicula]